jgi:hypothetical protein
MPAIPAPTMQTSALIFLSSAGMDGSFDVADQSETPSLEMEKLRDLELATRRREDRCAITCCPASPNSNQQSSRNEPEYAS